MTRRTLQAPHSTLPYGRRSTEPPAVDPAAALDALEDQDCRAILEAATTEARTARELMDRCDLSRSTAYRKLDALVDAGLLAEGIRIRPDGAHATEYRRTVEDLVVTVTDDGELVLDVERPTPIPQ